MKGQIRPKVLSVLWCLSNRLDRLSKGKLQILTQKVALANCYFTVNLRRRQTEASIDEDGCKELKSRYSRVLCRLFFKNLCHSCSGLTSGKFVS